MPGQSARFVETKRSVCLRALTLPCRGSSCLIWPISSVFKNAENARTTRSKSSQASGRCAKTPHVRFVLCFTAQTGLRAQNPLVFIGFREAVPGPPKRPPKRLPGAKTPKPPGQGPQAPRPGPPRRPRCVCYCVLQSKLASGLKNLRFFNGFRAPKRPQVRFLLCFTDQTCLRS